jgi:NhaP-type Na+/H+ or K+/H+ antiporter
MNSRPILSMAMVAMLVVLVVVAVTAFWVLGLDGC